MSNAVCDKIESGLNEAGWIRLSDHLVTREEYEGLFNAIVRLTDRIEALEAESAVRAAAEASMVALFEGDTEPMIP